MPALATDLKAFIEDYFHSLSGNPKTDELIDRYTTSPALKEHIHLAESGFPGYKLIPQQIVTEGDTAAVRAIFEGTHLGAFNGVPATGRVVSAGVMLFYRIADGRIAEHWMQIDAPAIMTQLTA